MITQLEAMIQEYVQTARQSRGKTSVFGVLAGNREDTHHPCHGTFYEETGKWVEAFAASSPTQEEIYRAMELLLLSAEEYVDCAAYWYLVAIQNHGKTLAPLLDDEHREQIRKKYEKVYPREKQLPSQIELMELLGGRRKRRWLPFL